MIKKNQKLFFKLQGNKSFSKDMHSYLLLKNEVNHATGFASYENQSSNCVFLRTSTSI